MNGTLIKSNGAEIPVHSEKENFSLEEMYSLIGCEMVQVIYLADGKVMWLDEEAKLKVPNQDNMPNLKATILLREAGCIPGDIVLGNVLITDEPKEDEEK